MPAPRRSRLRKLWIAPFVWLALASFAMGAVYFQPPPLLWIMGRLGLEPGGGRKIIAKAPAAQAPAPVANPATPRPVAALGKLVPEGDVTSIAAPYGAGDARLAALHVKEGESVAAGALLAELDNGPALRAALSLAEANLAARRAALDQAKASARASLAETRAALEKARTAQAAAARELGRLQPLYDQGFVSGSAYDNARSARDQAAREAERLQATLSRYESAAPEDQPDVRLAAANVAAAESDAARARADLAKSEIRAPQAGAILEIRARPGERLGADGLLDMANIDQMTAELEVYQSEVGRLRLGDAAVLETDALSAPLRGQVARIDQEVRRQKLVDSSPAANTDARVVRVVVALDEASARAARGLTGLQVRARLTASGGGAP